MSRASAAIVPYWQLSGFYFTYFALLGALFPYWSLYLESLGFSASEIGLLLAIPMVTKVIAPNVWGWLADHTGKRLQVIRYGSAAAFLSFAIIFIDQNFGMLVLVLGAYSFFWNAVLPQHEVITVGFLERNPEQYGRVRVWGSVGFILTVIGCGSWFQLQGIDNFPIAGAALLVAIWVSSLWIPDNGVSAKKVQTANNFIDECARPVVIAFLIAGCLLQVAHGVYYSFFSIYMESLGFTRTSIGLFWAIGVGAEIITFIFMHHFLLRAGVRAILIFSVVMAVIRWILIGHLAGVTAVLVIAQAMHAFTFGTFHSAAIESVRRLFSPGNQGKGQAIYSAASFGAGGAIGSIAGGYIWEVNPVFSYDFAALVCLIAALILIVWLKDERLK